MRRTPGLWAIGAGTSRGLIIFDPATDNTLAYVVQNATTVLDEEAQGNARLVAAAPELLDALETLLDITPFATNDKDAGIRMNMRALIRKARGEQ